MINSRKKRNKRKKKKMLSNLVILLIANNLALATAADVTEFRIESAQDFIKFSSDVASGTSFEGTTVVLDSDIEFSPSENLTKPIGDFEHNFLGTLDGHGSVIAGLSVNATSTKYVGLFGYSKGITVKNVVMDGSCTVASAYEARNDAYVGGIIGYCTAYYGSCTVENVVNMGTVAFTGNVGNYSLSLGGIAGYVYSYSHAISVLNCAVYGAVTSSGVVGGDVFIGGVAGYFEGYSSTSENAIRNSVNYGEITHTETAVSTAANLFIGALVGRTMFATFENCVSAGKVSPSENAGTMVGCANSTIVNHCYWTVEVGAERVFGLESSKSLATESSLATPNSTLTHELNRYASLEAEEGWAKWLFNANNSNFTVVINNGKGFSVSTSIVLLMEPSSTQNYNFSGWFADAFLADPVTPSDVMEEATLYGLYGVLATVKFDPGMGNVTVREKLVAYGKPYGEMPEATIGDNKFIWWYSTVNDTNTPVSEKVKVNISGDHTLYAGWEMNTVTFDLGTGKKMVYRLECGSQIVYPKNPKRDGYKFVGWDKNVTTVQGWDVTITALWSKKKASTGLLVAHFVVPIVIVAIIAAVVVVIVIRKKRESNRNRSYSIFEDDIQKALVTPVE